MKVCSSAVGGGEVFWLCRNCICILTTTLLSSFFASESWRGNGAPWSSLRHKEGSQLLHRLHWPEWWLHILTLCVETLQRAGRWAFVQCQHPSCARVGCVVCLLKLTRTSMEIHKIKNRKGALPGNWRHRLKSNYSLFASGFNKLKRISCNNVRTRLQYQLVLAFNFPFFSVHCKCH